MHGQTPTKTGVARWQQRANRLTITRNTCYIGYITPDKYYHLARYETRDMNWFGPNNGAYFTELMRGMLVSQK